MGANENRIKKLTGRLEKLKKKIVRSRINKNFEERYSKEGVFSHTHVHYEDLKNKELQIITEITELNQKILEEQIK